jgi:LPXTG-motif cell wall-anchored protein
VLGVILVVSAVLGGSDLYFFGAVGVVMAGAGGYLLYDRRQRIQRAAERGGATAGDEEDEGEESIF